MYRKNDKVNKILSVSNKKKENIKPKGVCYRCNLKGYYIKDLSWPAKDKKYKKCRKYGI